MRGRWMTRVGVLLTWLAFAGQAVSATTDSRLATLQDALYHDPVQADQAVAEALAAGWLEQWRAKLLLATAHYQRNEFQASLKVLAEAEPLVDALAAPQPKAQLQSLVAQNFYRMGSMDQAMQAARTADRYLEAEEDRALKAQIYNIIAAIYLATGDRINARSHFERSLALFQAEGSQADIAKLHNNLGALLIEDDDLDAAEPHLRTSLELARTLGRTTTIIPNLVNLSELHARRGQHEQARAAIEACFQTANASEESHLVWCHEAASFQLRSAGNLVDAVLQARQALAFAERFGLQQHIVDTARNLAAMLAQLNLHEEAAAMNDKAYVTMNAIRDQLLRLRLEQSNALIDYERARAEVQQLQLQDRYRRRNQWLLIGGVAVLFPLLLASLWLLRSRSMAVKSLALANRRNAELALTDLLTGLPNRRALRQRLEALAAGSDKGRELVLAQIDIDNFKQINDRFGHELGDKALRQVAEAIGSVVPDDGMAARWGGEEFILVMPGVGISQAHSLCQRLQAVLRETEAAPCTLTVSIGLAAGRFEQFEVLIATADAAMYAAKRAGRDRIEKAPAADALSASGKR